jgi:hypothetical protein
VEAQLEHAKREVLSREAAAQRAPSRSERPVAPDLCELEHLAKDVKRLFEAPTTTNRDRKEILRALIDHVAFEGRSREWINARIYWADDHPETVLRIRGSGYGRAQVIELGRQGWSVDEIHRRSEAEEWTTRTGTPWSREWIRDVLRTEKNLSLENRPGSKQLDVGADQSRYKVDSRL